MKAIERASAPKWHIYASCNNKGQVITGSLYITAGIFHLLIFTEVSVQAFGFL